MRALILSAEKRNIYFRDPRGGGRHGNAWYPELGSGDANCRVEAGLGWTAFEIDWSMGDNPVSEDPWTDAIGFGKTIRGLETLVSEKARDALVPYVADECQFLPIEIVGAPRKYFVLYVTRLLNCLDRVTTRFGRDNPFGPRLISVPRIAPELVGGFLFRLSGGQGYQFDYDFATDEFLQLIRQFGLGGFEVQETLGAGRRV